MNLGEIKAEVRSLIEDVSFDGAVLTSFINQAFLEVAASKDLPDLKLVGTIVTVANQPWVNLPERSDGKVTLVKHANNSASPVTIVSGGLEELVIEFGNLETAIGTITKVAVQGSILWYSKIPETPQTLIIVHYAKPVLLSSEDDIPQVLPAALHYKLLVNGAARLAFEQIEQDIEGEKAETIRQEVLFEDGLRLLGNWIESRVPHMRRKGNFWNA